MVPYSASRAVHAASPASPVGVLPASGYSPLLSSLTLSLHPWSLNPVTGHPVQECTLKGLVHATDAAWEGVLHDTNVMLDPDQPADFPPEEGPFKFVPNPYTRKQ